MTQNGLKELFDDRQLKVGTMVVEFDTPGIGQILKAADIDFAFVDMEHSGFGIESVKRVMRYMQAADLPALVRPPSREYHHIARALDAGADGVMLPMVSTVEDVTQIVNSMKYAPDGARGVALGVAHDRYMPGTVMDKLEAANRRTVCIPLIETAEGVRNIDAIAAVEGVDALWIGHFDLSCSLGIPGQFDHSYFHAAVDRVVEAAKAAGKSLGRMVPSVEEGARLFEQGFDVICYSGDVWLLQNALSDGVGNLRAACT